LTSPDRTEAVPPGDGLAHFAGFFHGRPPEWRVKGGVEITLSEQSK